ncbi:uroporphyrinogen-III synthase [Curtobacterium ammoniigenes]|uniref:uroporphyrinogen-III synthase n=1 Tax=Curtobacterium ammoniigenes TaxID=395387 RepID=UPI00082D6489|nr:uroporphyrinogen-III synthase [Curtobacterium ammoniigenes]
MPRGGPWGERVAAAARARGLAPVVVPLIAAGPPSDLSPLHEAATGLVNGSYEWVVVTSAAAVSVVAGRVPGLRTGCGGVRVAAVGDATADACRQAGWTVDVVPEDASAADLAAIMPQTTGRVLVPRSDLAGPTLAQALRARGADVHDVVAYRTVGTGTDALRFDAPPDAIMVTSGSVAQQVAARLRPLDPSTRIACIGPRTAAETRAIGLPVHVVAHSRSAEALLDAIVADLEHVPLTEPAAAPAPPGEAP